MGNLAQEYGENFGRLAENQDPSSIETLKDALRVRDGGTYEKHIIPNLACRALVSKGKLGIEAMYDVLPQAPGAIYPLAILNSLFRASIGEYLPFGFDCEVGVAALHRPIDRETQQLAREKFLSFVEECKTNPSSFDQLLSLMTQEQFRSMGSEALNRRFHETIFGMLADSTLKVSDSLIRTFSDLLAANAREEEYQVFLANNPVFLDPLASHLIPKHRLGDEFITDYILETLTGNYIAVEIEKPSDPVFTQSNDFSYQFTHAFGQVLDFIEWIEQNIAYAQRKLPSISSPRGLVVIGRRKGFTQVQEDKLRRFNRNSASIEVVTFDDLLNKTRNLHKNIRHRVVFNAACG